jgi:hypothetical protein
MAKPARETTVNDSRIQQAEATHLARNFTQSHFDHVDDEKDWRDEHHQCQSDLGSKQCNIQSRMSHAQSTNTNLGSGVERERYGTENRRGEGQQGQ